MSDSRAVRIQAVLDPQVGQHPYLAQAGIGYVLAVIKGNGHDGPESEAQVASRLATAWNACEGIPTEQLKPGVLLETANALKVVLAAAEAAGVTGRTSAQESDAEILATQVTGEQRPPVTTLLIMIAGLQLELHQLRSTFRPAVRWFAAKMEDKLAANDHKGGWKGWPVQEALWKLEEELDELHTEVSALTPDPERIAKEAADAANILMMIADMYRGCPDGPQGKGAESDVALHANRAPDPGRP